MLFNSWAYLALVTLTFLFYYLPALRGYQIGILIFSSFIFYGYHNPWLLLLLLASIFINTFASFKVAKDEPRRKFWAISGVVANLSILAFFKYTPLIASSLYSDWKNIDGIGHFIANIPLPIGISFFTFQGISLVIDVYKEKSGQYQHLHILTFKQHLLNTSFFKAFFPQLIAGPIVKAHDFYFQITPKYLKDIDWEKALKHLILGYFLKCVVADNIKDQTFWISFPYFQTLSSVDLIAMLFGYSMQIFADFAGYSYIALGSARLFGYKLIENFNWPYISTSFSEFWRRWHISLSSFLREYLYIPLGGNRKGTLRTYINLFIVMFLGGLWHGAAWSYAVWGTAHGLALALERISADHLSRATSFIPKYIRLFFQWLLVFSLVTLVWLLFRLPNFSEAVLYINTIFNNFSVPMGKTRVLLNLLYGLPVVLFHIWYLLRNRFKNTYHLELVGYSLMIFLLITNSGGSGDFIYFQF